MSSSKKKCNLKRAISYDNIRLGFVNFSVLGMWFQYLWKGKKDSR